MASQFNRVLASCKAQVEEEMLGIIGMKVW
jgi:hypothetical protein